MLWFVADAGEDVADDRAPDFGVVFAAAGLPEDEAFVRVFDEDAVPGGSVQSAWWFRVKQRSSGVSMVGARTG